MIFLNLFDRTFYWFRHHFEASYSRRIIIESFDLLGMLWPYLVGGVLLSTLVYMYLSKQAVARFFSSRVQHVSILLAAIMGVLSPLGSYVVIPLAAALFAIGVPLPVLMAFMVSSPLINPNLFLLTAGAMGLELALMRTFSAMLLGVVAGYSTKFLMSTGKIDAATVLRGGAAFTVNQFIAQEQKRTWRLFFVELYKMAKYVSRYFFLAIFIAAVIKILANPAYLIRLFNANDFISVLLTTAAGVPFYVCGGAAIPVVQQLAELGLSKGAVLAFFISGPVTKISNLVILSAAFNRKILVIYLLVGIVGAFILGLLYQTIF